MRNHLCSKYECCQEDLFSEAIRHLRAKHEQDHRAPSAIRHVNVHEWLMFAHYRQPPRALDYAHFVLMDHGYKVSI
jgi:hypothetical protein